MKKLKSIIVILLCAVLLLPPITAYAATTVKVTPKELQKLEKILEICRPWFAVTENEKFVFDTKTKTDMACYYLVLHPRMLNTKHPIKDVKSVMKSFFGNDKTNKENEKYITSRYSGEFGTETPLLMVKKIIKTGNNTYKISVISMSKVPNENYTSDDYYYNGEYEIGLKSGDYDLGFIITSIKKK